MSGPSSRGSRRRGSSPRSCAPPRAGWRSARDRKSTRLNSSHTVISYAVFCLKKKNDSAKDDRSGKKHIWRIYDYANVILLYYNMYQVARLYTSMTKYLHKIAYLDRTFSVEKT